MSYSAPEYTPAYQSYLDTQTASNKLKQQMLGNLGATMAGGISFPKYLSASYDYSGVQSNINSYKSSMSDLGNVSWKDISAQRVSATAAADESYKYNLSHMGDYTSMAKALTQADMTTKRSMLNDFAPDWERQRDQASGINESWMRGEVSKDVQESIGRTAAYKSLMGGGYGGNARSLTARDLGLTSMQLQQQGQTNAQSWTQLMNSLLPQQTTAAGVMQSQGLSPAQTLQTALTNASNTLQADITNVQGRTSTALQNQQIKADALWKATDSLNTNIGNKYAADMNKAAAINATNREPFEFMMGQLGWASGQSERGGFGINAY